MYPTWKNRGCYSDSNPNRSVRTLNTEVTIPGGCVIEFSAGTTSLPISDCFTPCTGDPTEYCGTNGALLLYNDE
ncbi:hypothetical protein EI94DRAFT_1726278 [Lactarius quietus]|nr:hypothetical protein EI94DRAFT_1726278 [Lactarius quietus]